MFIHTQRGKTCISQSPPALLKIGKISQFCHMRLPWWHSVAQYLTKMFYAVFFFSLTWHMSLNHLAAMCLLVCVCLCVKLIKAISKQKSCVCRFISSSLLSVPVSDKDALSAVIIFPPQPSCAPLRENKYCFSLYRFYLSQTHTLITWTYTVKLSV